MVEKQVILSLDEYNRLSNIEEKYWNLYRKRTEEEEKLLAGKVRLTIISIDPHTRPGGTSGFSGKQTIKLIPVNDEVYAPLAREISKYQKNIDINNKLQIERDKAVSKLGQVNNILSGLNYIDKDFTYGANICPKIRSKKKRIEKALEVINE